MKNGPPKYFKDLEEIWRNKRRKRRTIKSQPKGLRAPVLMAQLMRWSALWKDPRFEACWCALLEHKIVEGNPLDGTVHFTGREGPQIDEARRQFQGAQREIDEICLSHVRTLMGEDKAPEYRACAIVAAKCGRPANSFEAAVEQLRHLLRKSGKRARTQKSSHPVAES